MSHSGSTAGYRAHLTRFPKQHLSVAVLCNVATGTATQYAQAAADMFLGSAITQPTVVSAPLTTAADRVPLQADASRPRGVRGPLCQRRGGHVL